MGCYEVLEEICELVEEAPLVEFHGAVKSRIFRCMTPNGAKCFIVYPEVPEEGYNEYVEQIECEDNRGVGGGK